MSDRLTVILSPVLSDEEREQEALDLCGGSLTEGSGAGYGYGNGYGYGQGDGRGNGYADGNGKSSTHV